jgi:hypothetical protein
MNLVTTTSVTTTPTDRAALIRAEVERIKTKNPELKDKLDWPDIWDHELLSRDKAGRWDVDTDSPAVIADYVQQFRTPSRAWPKSRATPLLTKKAARYIAEHDLLLALRLNLKAGVEAACKAALREAATVD